MGYDDKKSTSNINFYGFGVGTTGFLAGITFATMVLLIQFESQLGFLDILITATAIISVLFIVSTLGMMRVASGQVDEKGIFSQFTSYIGSIAFLIFMGILPAILIQITFWGGILVIAIEIFVLGFFLKFAKKKNV